MRVLVFGASITYGQGGIAGSWVEKVREYYDNVSEKDVTIFNLGIPGDTSSDVLKRFKSETEARIRYGELAFVISVGTNDSKTRDGKDLVTLDQYRNNLNQIILLAKNYSSKILFVELLPCVSERITSRSTFLNERIKEYNQVMVDVCSQNDIPVVPLFDEFSKFQSEKDSLPDGLHPNDDGYKFMVQQIKPVFDEVIVG